jgi:hypothetical protein
MSGSPLALGGSIHVPDFDGHHGLRILGLLAAVR